MGLIGDLAEAFPNGQLRDQLLSEWVVTSLKSKVRGSSPEAKKTVKWAREVYYPSRDTLAAHLLIFSAVDGPQGNGLINGGSSLHTSFLLPRWLLYSRSALLRSVPPTMVLITTLPCSLSLILIPLSPSLFNPIVSSHFHHHYCFCHLKDVQKYLAIACFASSLQSHLVQHYIPVTFTFCSPAFTLTLHPIYSLV